MNITDYFAVEPIIVKHIAESMPDLLEVNTPFTVDDMLQNSNVTPSVSVIYHDDRMGTSSSNGKVTTQYQQWLIVLCVRDPKAQSGHTNSIREYANPFILQLLDCMQGFAPNLDAYRSFKRVDSPVGVGRDVGFGYFPFLFEVQMFI